MKTPERAPTTYASAYDLPTFVEARQQLLAMRALSLLKPSIRPKVVELEAEFNRLASLIDRFYDTLGGRNWLFPSDLNATHVSEVCELGSIDEQEAALIALYQDRVALSFMVARLGRHPRMRQRMPLLEEALKDYQAGRYMGMIHVLISVMDGFVNDFDTNPRRGLHARDGRDMTAWDSVVSHHKGLARVHETVFRKGFYRLSTDEVVDLYRHGIVHGMLTNYANLVVATKAWNYLGAVADWATAREKAAQEPESEPTLGEMFHRLADLGAQKRAINNWQRRAVSAEAPSFRAEPVYDTCTNFLLLWQQRNFGDMCNLVAWIGPSELRTKPGEVKELYRPYTLNAFALTTIRYEAPSVALVDVDLTVNGAAQHSTLRWLYQDSNGDVRVEPQPGEWRLMPWGPTTFLDEPPPS